jgi:hypothetical protein
VEIPNKKKRALEKVQLHVKNFKRYKIMMYTAPKSNVSCAGTIKQRKSDDKDQASCAPFLVCQQDFTSSA